MWLFWLLLGFLVGLFTPTPFSEQIKGWLKNLWKKISGWFKNDDSVGV